MMEPESPPGPETNKPPTFKVGSEARTALETTGTIRCLAKRRYKQESRLSRDGKAWADRLADKACEAMMRDLGRDESAFDKQLLMVELRRTHAYFCFDVFLRDGEKPAEDKDVDLEKCKRADMPVYRISRIERGVHSLELNKAAGRAFGVQYVGIQKFDKGFPPYFRDAHAMSTYIDGRLVEDPAELETEDSPDEEEKEPGNGAGKSVEEAVDNQT
ncbi:hypothetical protein GGS20DRAFT_564341 [Poronia punctata]|nr:hypothetical protein GGS20DRAFT_564341 [Poronia punctata]